MNSSFLITVCRVSVAVSMVFAPQMTWAHQPESARQVKESVSARPDEPVERAHGTPMPAIRFTSEKSGDRVTVILDEEGKPSVLLAEIDSKSVATNLKDLETLEFEVISADGLHILDLNENGKDIGYARIEILGESSARLTVYDAKGNVLDEGEIEATGLEGTFHGGEAEGGNRYTIYCAALIGAAAVFIANWLDDDCVDHLHSHTYEHFHTCCGGNGLHSHTYTHTHPLCHD